MMAEMGRTLLESQGLKRADVRHWVLHSAGRRVLDRARVLLDLGRVGAGPRPGRAARLRQHVLRHDPLRARARTAAGRARSGRVGRHDRARPGLRRRGRAAAMVMARATEVRELLDGPLPAADLRATPRRPRPAQRLVRRLRADARAHPAGRRAAAAVTAGWWSLDVGGGRGDLAVRIVRWARRAGRPVRVSCSIATPPMLALARRRTARYPEIALVCAEPARCRCWPRRRRGRGRAHAASSGAGRGDGGTGGDDGGGARRGGERPAAHAGGARPRVARHPRASPAPGVASRRADVGAARVLGRRADGARPADRPRRPRQLVPVAAAVWWPRSQERAARR